MLLSASKRFKRLPQLNPSNLSFSSFLPSHNHCDFSRGKGKSLCGSRFLGFKKFLSGYMSTTCYFDSKYIASISVRPPWIWPFIAITGNYKSFATQSSSTDDEVANQVLNHVLTAIQNNTSSMDEICTTYITKLCRDKSFSAATRLLKSLHDKNLLLSVEAYNLLLGAASEENDTDLASIFFKDMLFYHQYPNSVTYLNLARAFKKTDDSLLLLNFVREVSELTSSKSATFVNRIIYTFADCGQVDKALLIFKHVKSLKCRPDLITYYTILGILGRTARIDEMLHEFASMKERGMIPDIISYNTLIHTLGKVGRLDLCLMFLKEMCEKGIMPDLRTYTSLIERFGRAGKVEESLRIFKEMKDWKIRPSIYVYRSLISNLRRMGRSELALAMYQEMNACLVKLVCPKDFKRKNKLISILECGSSSSTSVYGRMDYDIEIIIEIVLVIDCASRHKWKWSLQPMQPSLMIG